MPVNSNFHFKADWSNGPENPKLHISCPYDPNSARTFFEQFKKLSEKQKFKEVMRIDSQGIITFSTSQGRGTPGVHLGPISGGLVINFLSPALRDIFMLYFKELKTKLHCETPSFLAGTTSLYFSNHIPTPEQAQIIKEHEEQVKRDFPNGAPRHWDVSGPSFTNTLLGPDKLDAVIQTPLTAFTQEELDEVIAESPGFSTDAVSWVGHGMGIIHPDPKGVMTRVETEKDKQNWNKTISEFFDSIVNGVMYPFAFMQNWIISPIIDGAMALIGGNSQSAQENKRKFKSN